MFTIGQIVYVKVMDKCHGEKEEILLSLLPEDINAEVNSGAWAQGNVLLCAVQDEEDHGYLMETGVKGFKAFLPKKNVKTPPSVGELVFCKIQKITPTAVTLSAFKKNELQKIETDDVPNMKTLLPGCVINFSIVKAMKNGLEGLIFDGSISAYANEMYLPSKLSINDSQIIGKEVRARILYTMPLSNQLFVTLIVDEGSKPKLQIPFGTLMETAKVLKQTSGGILLRLDSNNIGFLPRKVIVKNLKNNFDIDSALIKYSPNSTHVVRVMDFNTFENCYLCTNDGKLLHEKYFGTYDLEIGKLVQAKVEEKMSDGYRLRIGNVRAFLKGIFLNKSQKISVGDDIRVRVAEVEHDAKFAQVTNLQGLVKDVAKVLVSKKQIKVGESFAGVVLGDNPKAFTILFLNHIKGIFLKTPESEADLVAVGGLKVGSVKNFEVKNVKGDRITLTIPKKVDTANLGKIFECKVTAVLPSGLQVFISDLKVYGKIPTNFLSEFPSLSPIIHSNIKENDKFEVVALVNNQYSRRDVEYYRKGAVLDFNEVNPGDVLRCFVKSVDEETIELECPLKNFNQTIKLNRNAFSDPDTVVLNPDDIVYVNVIAKNESHRNSMYVTPALHQVWKNEMDLPLGIVQSYLTDCSFLMEKLKKSGKAFGKFSIGQRITGTIKNVIGNNLLLEIEDGIFAQGTVDNVQSFKVGGVIKEAVIVWLDPVQLMIHVTLKEKCREEISVNQKADPKIVNEKKHKAIVVYFNDFVTVCTVRKSGQPLVYAPSKFHYNDFSPVSNRALGNASSKLVIKKLVGGKLYGAFVQDYKVFQKVEKFNTKLNSMVVKRKADDSNVTAAEATEVKKPKVILDVSDDENERKTETDESEDEQPKPTKVLQKINESLSNKGKKFGKSLKGAFKGTLKKSARKFPTKKRNFANKDSMLDENLVNLVSFKSLKEGEASVGKKPAKFLMKSTIGKKGKPKRLMKKK